MASKSLKITVRAPRGLKTSDPIIVKAQQAAQAVIDEVASLASTLKDLQSKGIHMTLDDLLSHRGASVAKTSGSGKRTVLTAAQKKQVAAKLKNGATASSVAEEFGVSTATVNNIKRSAGLTKPRK